MQPLGGERRKVGWERVRLAELCHILNSLGFLAASSRRGLLAASRHLLDSVDSAGAGKLRIGLPRSSRSPRAYFGKHCSRITAVLKSLKF